MSHSTLDDFYKGMRQPRYDGNNVLMQLKQLQGGASFNQSTVQTVTQTVRVTTDGHPPVPPIAALHNSQNSFDQHVAVSMTEQATSKMFNEQSFGK
jgi:hypothetical protein